MLTLIKYVMSLIEAGLPSDDIQVAVKQILRRNYTSNAKRLKLKAHKI